jgi:diguanylate cyclase (GGDEF)-like protein
MNKQLLLVDDSDDIHALIRAVLSTEPIDVHSATDPTYGLTLAASLRPDLVLLDLDMPVMDGYEVCRRIMADPALQHTPIVFLTANAQVEQKVRGLHVGAVDYITKPFSPGELVARVRAALRTGAVITDLAGRTLADGLTGLGNRKQFDDRLRGLASERARRTVPLTCTVLDVDGFADLRARCGDRFCDGVLRTVAEVLREVYRPEDVPCHLQAGDFAILTPATDADEAVGLARQFKLALARAMAKQPSPGPTVTCSAGIAAALDPFDQTLFHRAADALEQPLVPKADDLRVWSECNPSVIRRAA